MCSNYSAEILAGAGFDWLLIDDEHAPNDVQRILGQLQTIASYPSQPVVRPAWNDPVMIKIAGYWRTNLIAPNDSNAAQARAAISATRYPPQGIRGVGSALARASRWNRIADYVQQADEQICVLLQIETREALRNLPEILAVDGVDGVFIGPADLASDMGFAGNPHHPRSVKPSIAQ